MKTLDSIIIFPSCSCMKYFWFSRFHVSPKSQAKVTVGRLHFRYWPCLTYYRKIPKINAGAYSFQRPFSRGLHTGGKFELLSGFGYLIVEKEIYVIAFLLLCFILYLRRISKYNLPGTHIRRVDLTEDFLRYGFEGIILGGASWFSECCAILSKTN